MKEIVIVGVLDTPHSENVYMAKGFVLSGYAVTPINYRTLIQKYGYLVFEDMLLKYVAQQTPYLVIFCKCNGVDPETVKKCTQITNTWLLNPDPIQTIERCYEVVEHAKNSTISSCTGMGVVDWFKQQGVTNCVELIEGYDHDLYKPVTFDLKYGADISFIGSGTPERENFYRGLKETGFDVKFYGPTFLGECRNEDFAKVCSSSKIVLSINTFTDIPNYWSNRLQMTMACGACTFHYDPTDTIKNYFKNYVDLVSFKTVDDLINKFKDLSDEQLRIIGTRGREAVVKYSWYNVSKRIISILEENI